MQTIPLTEGTVLERIKDKVLIGDGCWEWVAYKNPGYTGGYGVLKVNGRGYLAHRVLKELLDGPPRPGTEADHLCRNRGCVRPDHIEWVTHAENVRRGPFPHRYMEACRRGHPFTPENTYRYRGLRHCRACRAAWMRKKRGS